MNKSLAAAFSMINQHQLRVQDIWDTDGWNEDKLWKLMGHEKTEDILSSTVKLNDGPDLFVWEVFRKKGTMQRWMQ